MTRSSEGDNDTYAPVHEMSEATRTVLAERIRARQPIFGMLLCELSGTLSGEQYGSSFIHSCYEATHGAINTTFRLFDPYETASMVAALTAPQLASPSTPGSRGGEDRA